MIVNVNTAKTVGLQAVLLNVETSIDKGIGIHLVGLADAAVKESLLRTVTALQANGYYIPGKRIVINLAPADLHKQGTGYDLPIAIGLIAASQQREFRNLGNYLIIGELGLDGSVRSVPGTFQMVEMAKSRGLAAILPAGDAHDAAVIGGAQVYGVNHLSEVIELLEGKDREDLLVKENTPADERDASSLMVDFKDIPGNEGAKRAMEIAAAGGHHVLLVGPPDSGKATMAKALTGILPPMTDEEAAELGRINSVSGRRTLGKNTVRPFRAPHYSASLSALLGGGAGDNILPGEVTLAHNGVLYIDEAHMLPTAVKDTLRAPLEDKKMRISRLKQIVEYPADFQMVLSIEPCPCGHYGEGDRCRCTDNQRGLFLNKVMSHPMMDHVDIQAWMHPLTVTAGSGRPAGRETSAQVAGRVAKAREIQKKRYSGTGIKLNANLRSRDIDTYCKISEECKDLLVKLMERLSLSVRTYTHIIKIARTIADLDGQDEIQPKHLAEAASYQFLNRSIHVDESTGRRISG